MVNEVNVAMGFNSHYGHLDKLIGFSKFVRDVCVEKGVPLTLFMSGEQMAMMGIFRDQLYHALKDDKHRDGYDIVGAMAGGSFINPRYSYDNPNISEIGGQNYNHVRMVLPWMQSVWGDYNYILLDGQLKGTIGACMGVFGGKIPVTFFPPDGIYAFAAADTVRKSGFDDKKSIDTVVVSGEVLGSNNHAKGLLYWASGLRHVVKTDNIQIHHSKKINPIELADQIFRYRETHNTPFIHIVCDIDEVDGNRGVDKIGEICWFADEAYARGINLVNFNAAAHWNEWQVQQGDLGQFWPGWDYWNNVSSSRENGHVAVDEYRNHAVGHLTWKIAEVLRTGQVGWDDIRIEFARHYLGRAADAACINPDFSGNLQGHFDEMMRCAWDSLRMINCNL
jgi:hypothetical protein